MDQFRRSNHNSSSIPPPITMRESAFSRPILPVSSSLLLPPKPLPGSPNVVIGSGSTPPPDPVNTYRECLRNHAATHGGHVVDGCGEFMPVVPAESMKCAACGCHRSFHRRESDHNVDKSASPSSHRLLLLPPPKTTESSSEERAHDGGSGSDRKKRFRTKFSSSQKEKMLSFAERVRWRVQKKDEVEMESFCREIGVTRQVLKVWLHNNKHLVKKQSQQELELVKEEVEQNKHQQNQEEQLGDEDI